MKNGFFLVSNYLRIKSFDYKTEIEGQGLMVRVAERSKAPDSRFTLPHDRGGNSGPHLWAWVRIPPLTQNVFAVLRFFFLFGMKSKCQGRQVKGYPFSDFAVSLHLIGWLKQNRVF